MQQEYVDHGLKVVCVNGFDDSIEDVKKILDEDHITHTILLGGRKVASDQYFTTAFPTTFWIDKAGNIVKRTTGFRAKDAEKLRSEIDEFLNPKH